MTFHAPFFAVLAAALAAACASPVTQTTAEGLVAIPSSKLDELYLRPNAMLRTYRKVMIEPVSVEFRSDYLSQQHAYNRLKNLDPPYDDPKALANEMATLLRASLIDAFTAAGYDIVSAPMPGAMRVRGKVTELYVNAPDRLSANTQRVFTRDAGTGTLGLEIRDYSGSQLLARAADRAIARQGNRLETTDTATNRLWFDTLFHRWAANCVAEIRK